MLELTYIEEKNSVQGLFERIFGGETAFPDGITVALTSDGENIGLAVANLYEDGVIIRLIGILPEYRKQKIGDFFSRALMYTLTLSGNPLYIDYYDEYYLKFGFAAYGGKMKADKIIYPSDCGGH